MNYKNQSWEKKGMYDRNVEMNREAKKMCKKKMKEKWRKASTLRQRKINKSKDYWKKKNEQQRI